MPQPPETVADISTLISDVFRNCRSCWKELFLTDVAYKIVAFIVLTPIVGILFRVLVTASGSSVLADQDILFFFLGPAGWICFVLVGGMWIGIIALEMAALMGILSTATNQKRLGSRRALRFAAANARHIILVTARLLTLTLLTIMPFLTVIGLIYVTLLGEYDINYYLEEKPPVFWLALGLATITVVALVVVLLRFMTSWFFALQLVLFEDIRPSRALRLSRERAIGHRWKLLKWILAWVLASMTLSSMASFGVVFFGRVLISQCTGSLGFMVFAVGSMLILWAGVNLVVHLLSTVTLSALLWNLYQQYGSRENMDPSHLRISESTGSGVRLQVTRTRLIITGLAGIVIAIAIGAGTLSSVQLEDHTEVTAHRGSSAAAPENTMAAIKLAIEDGADWVEIDVQETADGEVVVFHDSDFMKLARVNLKIWDATMADLKKIDIGSWFGPEFKDERVPTLRQVLDECKGKVGVNIELKYYGHDEQLELRVIDIVETHGMASQVVVMTLKVDAVNKMKSLRPDWKVGLLMSVSAGTLSDLSADFLAVNARFANRGFINSAHKLGKEVHVWTVNDAPTMSTMIGRGVDSLITDKPALGRSVLEQRAELSVPERLLLELSGMLGVDPEIGEQ